MSAHYWRNSGKPQKTQFISLQNSYHGETLGALSVTDVALFKDAMVRCLKQNATVLSPDWRGCGGGGECARLRFALRRATGIAFCNSTTPVLLLSLWSRWCRGLRAWQMFHPRYLQRAKELCDQYEVLLVADEIAVGMGRTGTMFAVNRQTSSPISCFCQKELLWLPCLCRW